MIYQKARWGYSLQAAIKMEFSPKYFQCACGAVLTTVGETLYDAPLLVTRITK